MLTIVTLRNMKIKKHLFKIATLFVAFSLGIGLAINTNTSHQEVDAAQYAYNYAPYTYSGNYYKDIDFSATGGMNGELRQSLSELIYPAGFYSYSGNDTGTLSEQLQQADEDPNNHSNMVMFYTRDSITKTWANPGVEVWNREHVWCQSLSNDNWGTSKGGTDILHLRPTYKSTNSTRNNHPYGNVVDKVSKTYNNMFYGYLENHGDLFEPLDCVKGDVARIIMYVWTTYNNSSKPLNIKSVFESYDTLLQWHTMDKPDELEGHRNDYCQNQSKQKNRNPFVDHPELGWKIFGDMAEHVSYKNDCMAAYPENGGGTPIEPTGISLNRTTGSVQAGSSLQLNATLQPSGATGTVTWSSDDTDVATVNSYGLVTGVSAGTATITASVASYNATCEITVTSNGGGGGGNTGDYVKIASYNLSSDLSGTGAYSASALLDRLNSSAQTGTGLSNIITNVTSCSKVYPGENGYTSFGIKMGSSSANGNFTVSLNTSVSRVVINTAGWLATDSVSVGGAASQIPGVAYSGTNPIKTLTFNFTSSSSVTFAYTKRGFIQSIDFYTIGEATDDPTNYLNNTYPVAYLAATETSNGTGSSTDSITFGLLGLENAVQYSDPFEIADGVTIRFDGGANDGKYYNTGSGIRTYGNGSIIIECEAGITQIVFSWDSPSDNKPDSDDVVNTGSYNHSTYTWTGSASNVTLTRPSGSGHWRLKGVTVTYVGQTVSVSNVKMRFGAYIPVQDWYDIEESWDVDYYGVMFLKYNTLHTTYGYSSIEEAYENGIRPNADVHTENGNTPLPLNGGLIFTARINITSVNNYGIVYVAAPYMVIDGEHYFLNEMEYSVNTMAQEYLENGGATLSNAALTILAGN